MPNCQLVPWRSIGLTGSAVAMAFVLLAAMRTDDRGRVAQSPPPPAAISTWEFGPLRDLGDNYQCQVVRNTDGSGTHYSLRISDASTWIDIPFEQVIPLLIMFVRIREHPPVPSSGVDAAMFQWEWNDSRVAYYTKTKSWTTTIREDWFGEENQQGIWPRFFEILEAAPQEMETMKKTPVSVLQK